MDISKITIERQNETYQKLKSIVLEHLGKVRMNVRREYWLTLGLFDTLAPTGDRSSGEIDYMVFDGQDKFLLTERESAGTPELKAATITQLARFVTMIPRLVKQAEEEIDSAVKAGEKALEVYTKTGQLPPKKVRP